MVRNLKNMKSRFYLLTIFSLLLLLSACGIFRRPNPLTHDEGVVINGILWATRNVDAPGTFAESPESFGMLFQWNRRRAWTATDDVTNWDSSIPDGVTWEKENDPCPPGWRVPTETELYSLKNSDNIWTTQNDVYGRLIGTAPYQIFLPAANSRNTYGRVPPFGNYWSNTADMEELYDFAISLSFMGHIIVLGANRSFGFSIRCVAL